MEGHGKYGEWDEEATMEEYDRIKGDAGKMLAGADGFVVFCAYLDSEDSFSCKIGSAVRNLPAPIVLYQARKAIQKMEREARKSWPGAD